MDMLAYINCMKSHSTKNPVAEAINSVLDQLNSISLTGISQALQDTFSQAKQFLLDQIDSVGAMMKKIKDGLPLLKASDSIFNKLKISQGIQPAADGGDGIKNLINNIGDMVSKATQFAVDMGNKIGNVISGVVTDMGSFISDLSSNVDTIVSAIGQNISNGLTTLSNTMSDLKDYAMAKFTSGIHLPSMSELMNKILPDECPAPSQAAIELDDKTASAVVKKKYEESITPSTLTTPKTLTEQINVEPATNTQDIPAPLVYGKTIPEFKSYFLHDLDALKVKIMNTLVSSKILDSEAMKYRDAKYPDYWDRSEKALLGNNDDIFIFERMKREFMASEPCVAWENKKDELAKLEAEERRLQKLWEKWQLEGFVNVPEGPW